VLGIILAGDLCKELGKPYGGYSWTSLILIGWGWVLLTLIVAFIIALRPWKTEDYKAGGRSEA